MDCNLWVGLYTRGRVQQTGKQMGGLNILRGPFKNEAHLYLKISQNLKTLYLSPPLFAKFRDLRTKSPEIGRLSLIARRNFHFRTPRPPRPPRHPLQLPCS